MAEDSNRSESLYGGTAEPCTVVLFGASGDLAKRKVIPAMFDLATHNSLGSRYVIVGFARTPMSDENFRATTGEAAKTMSEARTDRSRSSGTTLPSCLHYSSGDYSDPQAYAQLGKRLAELEAEKKLGGNRLFYLSTPPEVYPHIVEQLGRAGLSTPVLAELVGAHHH